MDICGPKKVQRGAGGLTATNSIQYTRAYPQQPLQCRPRLVLLLRATPILGHRAPAVQAPGGAAAPSCADSWLPTPIQCRPRRLPLLHALPIPARLRRLESTVIVQSGWSAVAWWTSCPVDVGWRRRAGTLRPPLARHSQRGSLARRATVFQRVE